MADGNGTTLALVTTPVAHEAHGLDMVRDLQGVFALADALKGAAGFLPSWVQERGQVIAVLLAGREMGIPPMRAFRVLHMIEGKVELAASEMASQLIKGGVRIEWIESDHEKARAKFTRPGFPPHVEGFTIDDAKRAGLAGRGNWGKHPRLMLRARVVSAAARWWAPDLLGGNVYAEGEIEEEVAAPASSGSREVAELGAALHEVDEADPATPDPLAGATAALDACKTDDDLRAWVTKFSERVETAPDDTRRRALWGEMKKRARAVMPAVTVATVTQWFREAREARAAAKATPASDVVDGETEDPIAAMMDRLPDCETREAMVAWAKDDIDVLASIPRDSEMERSVWQCITARAEAIDASDVVNELDALVTARLSGNGSSAATGAGRQ